MPEWLPFDRVELVPAVAACSDQPGRLEHVEVLRDPLAAGRAAMFHDQAGGDLEQCLVVAIGQLVEDGPPGGIGQSLEDRIVGHASNNMQAVTCMSILSRESAPPLPDPEAVRFSVVRATD